MQGKITHAGSQDLASNRWNYTWNRWKKKHWVPPILLHVSAFDLKAQKRQERTSIGQLAGTFLLMLGNQTTVWAGHMAIMCSSSWFPKMQLFSKLYIYWNCRFSKYRKHRISIFGISIRETVLEILHYVSNFHFDFWSFRFL